MLKKDSACEEIIIDYFKFNKQNIINSYQEWIKKIDYDKEYCYKLNNSLEKFIYLVKQI